MTTELARIETITAVELFKPGTIDPLLERIKEQVRMEAAALDISTETNRKALASLAFKVAKSKTFIDGQRKALVSEEKARLKAIDQEGSRIWDELEALQLEVRKPLTDWENAEKSRVAKHEAALAELIEAGTVTQTNWQFLPLETMRDRLKEITDSEYDWQEFKGRAVAAVIATISQIKDAIAKRETLDAERAELERLRAEQAKREQQEREDRIASEAKAKADLEAKQREEQARIAAERERQRIENERNAAEARAKQAEAQKAEAEAKAKRDAEQAKAAKVEAERIAKAREEALIAKAEEEKKAAIAAEQKRVAEAKAREEAETVAREKDKAHKADVHSNALSAIVALGVSHEDAKKVITAIAKGQIPAVKISY